MLTSPEITELLVDWSNGKPEALEKLFPFVEKELHRMAHRYMVKLRPGNTLQTTAIINETYLRLLRQNPVDFNSRSHFFALAAVIMRRFLFNYIRDRKLKKNGGGEIVEVQLAVDMIIPVGKSEELIELEHALRRLAEVDPRKEKVVELRFYGGLSNAEIARVLNISEVTVTRDWNMARAWLAREIAK